MKPLIAIVSCHKNGQKRDAQRATWVHAINHIWDVRFFLGRPTGTYGAIPPDEVWLDVPDNYLGIPLKVQRICSWVTEYGYPYVAKVDDDVYGVPSRILALPFEGYDYVGRFRGPYGNYPAHYASGFWYWLSLKSANWVAEQPWNHDWMDERFVANTLALHGVSGYNDARNYVVSGPHIAPCDVPNRQIIRDGAVFCEYFPKQIMEMHEVMGTAAAVSKYPSLSPCPCVQITDEQLAAPPGDKAPPEKVNRR